MACRWEEEDSSTSHTPSININSCNICNISSNIISNTSSSLNDKRHRFNSSHMITNRVRPHRQTTITSNNTNIICISSSSFICTINSSNHNNRQVVTAACSSSLVVAGLPQETEL
mmetsp:Transcript_21866/g.36589  ORF Transcript_21866/g.36589 Transcript_21866/m.36589 type:complete len:115 (-) Transcript_21866:317-661(-)